MKQINFDRKTRRKKRVSSVIWGTKTRPRISVFRSNRYLYGQAIDDKSRVTIASFSSLNIPKRSEIKIKKLDEAKQVGLELGKLLKNKKIKEAVFDRGRYGYKGRVKEFCEGVREVGVKI